MSLLHAAKKGLANQSLFASLNAFVSRTNRASIVARAQVASKIPRLAKDEARKSLVGKLMGIKDNICTVGLPTTAASGILENFSSPYDATVVKQLRNEGVIITGKTNMDEFGMGSHSTCSHFGPVKFSRHAGEQLSAGGSSGGSAVAVATQQCWAALGTDTGGSVRLPAAYTGVVGFKPSYGLLSRWGVIAYANSLDTVGILAETVDEVESIFNKLNAYDAQDPTSLLPSTRSHLGSSKETKSLRIGIPLDYNISSMDPAVRKIWIQSLRYLDQEGHSLHPVSLPTTRDALSAYYVLAPAEASSNLAKYDGVRYGNRAESTDGTPSSVLFAKTRGQFLGPEVRRRILLGAFSLSAQAIDNYFIQAQKVRRLVADDFNRVFEAPNPLVSGPLESNPEGVDVLLCPTAPTLPPSFDKVENQQPLDAYTNDVFTVPASLAGLPAISVPVSIVDEDRNTEVSDPNTNGTAGMQFIGQYGNDSLVLDVARQLMNANVSDLRGNYTDTRTPYTVEKDRRQSETKTGTTTAEGSDLKPKQKLVKVPPHGWLEKYPSNKEKKNRKKFGAKAEALGMTVEEYVKMHESKQVPPSSGGLTPQTAQHSLALGPSPGE